MEIQSSDRPLSPAQILARGATVPPVDQVAVQVAANRLAQTAGGAALLAVTVPQLQQAIGIRPPTRNPFAF